MALPRPNPMLPPPPGVPPQQQMMHVMPDGSLMPGPPHPGSGPLVSPDPAMMGAGPPGMMPGMPPPGMPGFPPGVMPDPNYPGSPAMTDAELMIALQDPEVAQALIRLLLAEIDPDRGPKYPVWYDKDDYPKPKLADITTKADDDREAYRLLIDRMRRDRDRIHMAVVGVFDDFDPEVETTFRDASLALDIQLITSILSAAEILVHKTARHAGDREESQKIENLCYGIFEQAERRHHNSGGMNLKVDLVKTAMNTGHLVTRILPKYDADDGEIPLMIDLLDPATCFPTWDEHGIETMTRRYVQSVKEVCRGFRLNKKQKNKILNTQKKQADGTYRQVTLTDTVDVIEFWNRRWYGLVVEDKMIVDPTDHTMGIVPFRYTRSAVGDPSNIHEQNLKISYGVVENAMQHDLASKGQSHIQLLQKTHEQREAIMGVIATEIKKINNPPRTFEQAITTYGDAPAVSNAEGSLSMLKMGEEKEVPNPPDGRFQLMGPLLANTNEAAQMGRMSPADYGLAPGSQSSGAVVEGLSESSKDKLNLWKIMIQDHLMGIFEHALTILRDHGRKLGPEGRRGEPFPVELQYPEDDQDGYFDFDYRMLWDVTCRVKVQMTSLRMQNLGALGNAIQMWDNMGRMSDEDALRMRGVRDPQAYMRKVEIEKFQKTPEYQTAKLISWMKKEEMYDELPTVMYLLSTRGGSGGGGGGGGGQPGPMPGNGGGPPTVGMPGAAGQQGGRPPQQLPGPPPSTEGIP